MIDREIHHRNIYWMRTLFVRTHATSSSYAPTLSRCLSVTGRNRFNGKHWQNCGATITKLVKAIAKFSHAHRSDQTRPPQTIRPEERSKTALWLRVATVSAQAGCVHYSTRDGWTLQSPRFVILGRDTKICDGSNSMACRQDGRSCESLAVLLNW